MDEEAQAQLPVQERRIFLLHVSSQLPVIQVTMKQRSAIIMHSSSFSSFMQDPAEELYGLYMIIGR